MSLMGKLSVEPATSKRDRRVRQLRSWQQKALDKYAAMNAEDFLLVAAPAAGKTTFAAALSRELLNANVCDCIVVVVPTAALKEQWARTFDGWGIDLYYRDSADSQLPSDFHGACITYQSLADISRLVWRQRTAAKNTLVILDEIHHCADQKSWGDAVRFAFEPAARRLALSGTPFRSDDSAIPYLTYEERSDANGARQQVVPDFSYSYGEAILDNVCRPMFFDRKGGTVDYRIRQAEHPAVRSVSFDDVLDEREASYRRRSFLSFGGDAMYDILADAHKKLCALRQEGDADAGGLVIADSQRDAKEAAAYLARTLDASATVVTCDDPEATNKIRRFARSKHEEWIVAVRMVSEGIDIPRLRVGVYATSAMTELFFRQVVGRFVRWEPGHPEGQRAWLMIYDDPQLRKFAEQIKQEIVHALEQKEQRLLGNAVAIDGEWLPSELETLCSNREDRGTIADGETIAPEIMSRAEELKQTKPDSFKGTPVEAVAQLLLCTLDAPAIAGQKPAPMKAEERERLKSVNNRYVKQIARACDLEHANVNASLNRRLGIATIGEATTVQLERRLALCKKWLETGVAP